MISSVKDLVAHVRDQVEEGFLLIKSGWGGGLSFLALKRCVSLAVSPHSRTLCSAAAGQLHGENLLLLRGGREGP